MIRTKCVCRLPRAIRSYILLAINIRSNGTVRKLLPRFQIIVHALLIFRLYFARQMLRDVELTTTAPSNSSRQENQVLRDLPCIRVYTLCHSFLCCTFSFSPSTNRNPHFRTPFYDQIEQSVNNSLRILLHEITLSRFTRTQTARKYKTYLKYVRKAS